MTNGVEAGESTSYAWSNSGRAFSWGRGDWGQRGDGTTKAIQTKPLPIKNVRGVVKISSNRGHALVLQRDGKVFATGYNDEGQLGIGSASFTKTPAQVKGLPCIVDIATGSFSSFALSKAGEVYAWGYNADGELAVGNSWPAEKPTKIPGLSRVKQIVANDYNLFAIDFSGEVFGIGPNYDKQLGDSVPSIATSPVKLSNVAGIKQMSFFNGTATAISQSGLPIVWGDTYRVVDVAGPVTESATPIEIPFSYTASFVISGSDQSFLIDNSATLYSWGGNNFGALGSGKDVFCTPLESFGTGTCLGYDIRGLDYHVFMEKTQILTKVKIVAAGDNFALALKSDGTVWAWGSGRDGQLGNGYDHLSDIPVQVFKLNLNR
jgi:alpha-tubulin suppressor-like RCC1 family protein